KKSSTVTAGEKNTGTALSPIHSANAEASATSPLDEHVMTTPVASVLLFASSHRRAKYSSREVNPPLWPFGSSENEETNITVLLLVSLSPCTVGGAERKTASGTTLICE